MWVFRKFLLFQKSIHACARNRTAWNDGNKSLGFPVTNSKLLRWWKYTCHVPGDCKLRFNNNGQTHNGQWIFSNWHFLYFPNMFTCSFWEMIHKYIGMCPQEIIWRSHLKMVGYYWTTELKIKVNTTGIRNSFNWIIILLSTLSKYPIFL